MWYVFNTKNEIIAYTEDHWYAAEMKRAGFDVRQQRNENEFALEKETNAA